MRYDCGMNFSQWLSQGYGRVAMTARALNVSSPRVTAMRRNNCIPAEHAPTIEELSGGAVTCEEMRPDVKWHVLRGARPLPGGARAANAPASDGAVEVLMHPEACAASNDAAEFQPGRV